MSSDSKVSGSPAYGYGIATVTSDGAVLDTYFHDLGLGTLQGSAVVDLSRFEGNDDIRKVSRKTVAIEINLTKAPTGKGNLEGDREYGEHSSKANHAFTCGHDGGGEIGGLSQTAGCGTRQWIFTHTGIRQNHRRYRGCVEHQTVNSPFGCSSRF